MNTVEKEGIVSVLRAKLVKFILQKHELRIKLLCKLFNDLCIFLDLEESVKILLGCASRKHERLTKDKLNVRKCLFGIRKEHAVYRFKALELNAVFAANLMPDIVYSDKNAYNVGLEIPTVFFNS